MIKTKKPIRYLLIFILLLGALCTQAKVCDVSGFSDKPLDDLKVSTNNKGSLVISQTNTRISATQGEKFLEVLKPHGDMDSTTAFRMEEKVVMSEKSLESFLKTSQSIVLEGQGGKAIPKWVPRDEIPKGKKVKTITEYGKTVRFLNPESGIDQGFRPRFRKYFEYDEDVTKQALKNAQSIFPDTTVFELKIANMAGFKKVRVLDPQTQKFVVKEVPRALDTAVFKPRIFLKDELADKIKALDSSKSGYLDDLEKIEAKVLALKKPDGSPLNPEDKVESMFDALRIVLKSDKRLFEPDTVVSYNRTSYKYKDGPSEYQFTVDRGTEVFKAVKDRPAAEMKDYMVETPLYKVKEGEVFAELKTPIPVYLQAQKMPVYNHFIGNMKPHHIDSYDIQHGKYHLGKVHNKGVSPEKIDGRVDITEDGIKYWLVRSTGNVATPPKVKDIVEKRLISVGVPFRLPNQKQGRVIINYEPLNNMDGSISSVLSKIKILDELGKPIKMDKDALDSLAKAAIDKAGVDGRVVNFKISDQKIEFPAYISAEKSDEYIEFVKRLYYNPGKKEGFNRGIEDLTSLSTPIQLRRYENKLRYIHNPSAWLADRFNKQFFGAGMAIAGTFTGQLLYHKFTSGGEIIEGAEAKRDIANLHAQTLPSIAVKDKESGESLELGMKLSQDGENYIFLIPEAYQAKYMKQSSDKKDEYIFLNDQGESITLKLKVSEYGNYFVAPEIAQ